MSKIKKDIIKLKFDEMFNKFFFDKEKEKPRESCIHGSDVIKPDYVEPNRSDYRFCYRECVLKHYYVPHDSGKNGTYLNKIFLNGWVLHEKWQMLFGKYTDVIAIEETIWDDVFKIAFTPDAHIKFRGEEFIVEIKGWKQEEYDKLDEDGPCPESPMKQALLYCYLTGVKYAIVLVENKNSQAFKLWVIKYDPSIISDVIERLDNLKLYLDKWKVNNTFLPARICESRSDERAKGCPMSSVCFMSNPKREKFVKERERVD